jgi:O-antigen/teichoic acid export membrane protein
MGDAQQSRNARWNYTEVVVTSAALFVLYKFLLLGLGVAAVGIWSIVVATTSLGRMADLGTAAGLGRYIAIVQADATKDAESRADATLAYVETGLLFSALIFVMIGAVLYWPSFYAIRLAVPKSAIGVVAQLLPFSVLSFVTVNIANVALAALIGLHRSDLKSKMSILASLLQVVVAFAFKDGLGLVSLALAQVVQSLVMLVGGWLIVQYVVLRKPTLAPPRRLRLALLKDLAGFGMKVQLVSLLGLMSEPAIKYVLSIVGGLATVGMYELVTKGIVMVRQFVIAPTPNLVPIFVTSLAASPHRLARAYSEATASLAVFGGAAMALLAFGAPLISVIWLGSMQTRFVVYSVMMATGWAVNMVCIPGLSLAVATGRLGCAVVGNLITLVMGPAFGMLLGSVLREPAYVVAANAIAIGTGALLTASLACRSVGLGLLPDPTELLVGGSDLFSISAWLTRGVIGRWSGRKKNEHRHSLPR